jgi:homocitrate synthase
MLTIKPGWNAIKSRAAQLNIEMTDAQFKECTAKVKALGDIRPPSMDDTDAIIRAFHNSIKLDKAVVDLLPHLTEQEKTIFAKKEAQIDATVESQPEQAAAPPVAEASNGVAAS